MLLTLIQPKIQALKISYFTPHYANEYAKGEGGEGEDTFHKIYREVTNNYERLFIE